MQKLLKKTIEMLQRDKRKIEHEILRLAGGSPTCEPFFSVVGTWDCEKSPCGLCCYDHYKDPVHDFCIYCGKPEERK